MQSRTTFLLIGIPIFLVVLFLTRGHSMLKAAPSPVYPPATHVPVNMYELTRGGEIIPNRPCSLNNMNWGCTAFCNNFSDVCTAGPTKPYPYSISSPSVPIESDYLLDVVSHEAFPGRLSAVAVEANAIAARSFTYRHIQINSTIDNSTNKHVFVPYRFESLNPTVTADNPSNVCASVNLNSAQQKVCNGVAHRYYVSYPVPPNEDTPALTQYFSDIRNATIAGGQPYEVSVADPISSDPAIVQVGHGKGMSQNGASRWGYGNLGYRGNLAPWSIQWTRPEHILFHYYTGVHLRDANNNNTRLSPDYRWNPLAVNWGGGAAQPPDMYGGTTYNVTIRLQNTGAVNWGSNVSLSCRWKKPDGSIVNCETSANPGALTMGADASVVLPVRLNSGFANGLYTLMIDMKQGSTFFSNREAGKPWPTLNYKVCAGGHCGESYLPIVLKNWQPALPCTGVTTYPAGQPYCTDKDGVVRACHAENANGSGDNEPTGGKVTDSIYYYDYSAPGVTAYYLDLPAVISGTGVMGVHFEVLALGYGRNYQRAHFDVKNPDTGTWSTLFTVGYHAGQAGPEGVSADGFFSRRISAVRIWTENLEMYYKPIQVDYVYMRCN